MVDKPRRWFRFSLRTMLLVVTTACCILAWLSVQLKWNLDRRAALNRLHGTRSYVSVGSAPRQGLENITFLGERKYDSINWVRVDATDAAMARQLERLFPEAQVSPMDEIHYFERHRSLYSGRRVKTLHPLRFR